MISNLENSLLLLGALYLGYQYGFTWWIIGLMIFALCTWKVYALDSRDAKKILEAKRRYLEAKADYYRRQGKV
jgi:hypothetical protein